MARILLILAAAATTACAFVFDDRTDTSLLEPRGKKILDPVLEDREDIDYYEGTDWLILLVIEEPNLDGYVKKWPNYRFIFFLIGSGGAQLMGNYYVARL